MKVRANAWKAQDEKSIANGVRGYATLTLENCCVLHGVQIRESKDGELYVRYPQKPVFENGQPKLRENGKQEYTDIFWGNSKEVNDAIKAAVLEAYHSEQGYAYINPAQGEATKASIEPKLHACNDERVKAAGRLLIGGYMNVTDIFVNLAMRKDGQQFLSVSYPYYEKDGMYRDYVEPMEHGKIWDHKAQAEVEYDFKHAVEGVMKKQTREFHPELADALKPTVDERIADAKDVAEGAKGAAGKTAPEKEAVG